MCDPLIPDKRAEGTEKDSLDTIEVSREITLKDCKQGIIGGLFDSVLRVFAPLC